MTMLKAGQKPNPHQVYNLSDAARWLNMDIRTIKKEVKSGKLPGVKAGERTYRILGENLLKYARAQTVG